MSKLNKIGNNTSLFNTASRLNELTFESYYNRLKLLAMNMFEWENLPDSVSERFMEKSLYETGKALFFEDNELGFLCLKCTYANSLNVYEEPTEYQAYSINYSKIYRADDCVLIRNNYLATPTDMIIQQFAWRLYNAERAMDININAQKTPVMISCPDNMRMTMKNLYMKYDGNEPFIFSFKGFDPDCLKVLKTDAPLLTDSLIKYKQTVWQEAISYLGIGTTNNSKTERLNIPETILGNASASMSANTMLKTRLEACELINKKYGLNVSVKLRENIRDAVIGLSENEQSYIEGGEVESVGDGNG